jgi:hypothetical protein
MSYYTFSFDSWTQNLRDDAVADELRAAAVGVGRRRHHGRHDAVRVPVGAVRVV